MNVFDLKTYYQKKVVPELQKTLNIKNMLALPRLAKVVVNIGVGRMREEKQIEEVIRYLKLITGQQPHARPTKKAIASFKTRQGMIVGYRVTLRGVRMYDFLSRLIHIALPRMRDFKGIPSGSVDEGGNLTIGFPEYIVFPEMIGEDYRFLSGFQVTIVTTAFSKKEALMLFRELGFPFQHAEE